MAIEQQEMRFEDLLDIIQTVNSDDKYAFLGDCINTELAKVLRKVGEHRKGGKVVITLDILTDDRNKLNLLASVNATSPKGKVKQNTFYQAKDGALFMDDPDQLRLIEVEKVTKINKNKELSK